MKSNFINEKSIIIVGRGHVGRTESFGKSLTDSGVILIDNPDDLVKHCIDTKLVAISADLVNRKSILAQKQPFILKELEAEKPQKYINSHYISLTPRKDRIAKSKAKNNPIKPKYLGKKNPFKK